MRARSAEDYGLKMAYIVAILYTERFVGTKGQSNSSSFDIGLSYFNSFNELFEAIRTIVTRFHKEPPGAEGTQIYSNHSSY